MTAKEHNVGTSYTGLSTNISLAEAHIMLIPDFRVDIAADTIYFKGEGSYIQT